MNLRFYKNENRWYVDYPSYPGNIEDLQMVSGADDLLDLLTNFGEEITLKVELLPFDNCETLTMTENFGDSANYRHESTGIILWLCPVVIFVFGVLPVNIYFTYE